VLFLVIQMIVGNALHCLVIVGWIFALIVLVTTTSFSEYLGWHIRDCKNWFYKLFLVF